MDRYLHAIYCDDIRLEIGNKQSLMGIYDGALLVSEMPALVPKLCVITTVVTPVSRPFKKLAIAVKLNEEVLVERSPTEELLSQQAIPDESEETSSEKLFIMKSAFILSPLSIEHPCTLRVRAYTESEELRCPALNILKLEIPPEP